MTVCQPSVVRYKEKGSQVLARLSIRDVDSCAPFKPTPSIEVSIALPKHGTIIGNNLSTPLHTHRPTRCGKSMPKPKQRYPTPPPPNQPTNPLPLLTSNLPARHPPKAPRQHHLRRLRGPVPAMGLAQIRHLHLPHLRRPAPRPRRPHLLRPLHPNGLVQARRTRPPRPWR